MKSYFFFELCYSGKRVKVKVIMSKKYKYKFLNLFNKTMHLMIT